MRILMLHSDYFSFEVVEKTVVSEDLTNDVDKKAEVKDSVLVVFVCSEERQN